MANDVPFKYGEAQVKTNPASYYLEPMYPEMFLSKNMHTIYLDYIGKFYTLI